MSPRALVSIAAAAGLTLVVALALIVARQVSADQPVAAGGPMFPELNDRIDDLARIEISTARYDLTLELQGDQWVAVDFGNYPVGLEPMLQIVSSVLYLVTGILFSRNPGVAVATPALLLIVFFLVEGIAKIVLAFTVRPLPNWGWVLASGMLGLVIGLYLMFNPALSLWTLGLLVGFVLIAEGVALGAMA